MRDILFRGKRKDNGEWLQGLFIKDFECYGQKDEHTYIVTHKHPSGCFGADIYFEVIPETVGQYTGCTVPSGKIFEHDIVTAKFKSNGARFNFIVKYSNENGCYVFDNGSIKVPFCEIRSVRIIGNIQDNPELLKGGERYGRIH